MIFIALLISALSLGFLIGRNLKIIEYHEREEFLKRKVEEAHAQLAQLRRLTRPAPPLKDRP